MAPHLDGNSSTAASTKDSTNQEDDSQVEAMKDYYDPFSSALLVGEADFSFTSAFAKVFQGTITATEFSTDLLKLYFNDDPFALQALAMKQPPIHHIMAGVDAKMLGLLDCPCSRWNSDSQAFDQPALFWDILRDCETPPFDLVIFNCPHTDKRGKAARLLRMFFQQIRACVQDGRMAPEVSVELRLRDLEQLRPTLKRVDYEQDDAARRSDFLFVGTYPNDNAVWEGLGYEHKMTRRNATCRGLPCKVWRWKCIKQTDSGEGDVEALADGADGGTSLPVEGKDKT